MKRASPRALVLTAVLLAAVVWLRAAATIDSVGAAPTHLPASTPGAVLFTAKITDASVLATGVNLLRTDATGKTLSTIGAMHDDGLNGDATAGDKVFSLQVTLNEPAAGPTFFRVSAAFKGVLLRTLSPLITIQIDPSGPPAPPTIVATVNPAANANGWQKTNVTVSFICTGVAACPSPITVTTEGANQAVDQTVSNAAGSATAHVVLNIDKTPPIVTLTPPAAGATSFTSPAAVTGTVTDTLSGVAGVTCNGVAAALSGTDVNCSVALTPGGNSVTATATDLAGNTSTSSSLTLTFLRVPTVTLTSPSNLAYFNISPTTVTGTVDDPTATVTINSVPAPVVSGHFSIALPLAEGPNIIAASATSAAGAVGTASIEVNLDTTPPHVTITSPPDQFVTTDASISIAGNVNDIVVGTVNDQQARVSVNGAGAQVANRTFLATNVPLAIGANVIQAVATDRVGNAATTQITVTRQAVTQSHIRLISGNNQTGTIGAVLQSPLVIAITDAAGTPIPNKSVIFKVTQDDGLISAGAAPSPSLIATTDSQGQAQVQWTLGMRAGAGGNVAEAYAVGFSGTAIFTATGTQGPPGKIVVDTGDAQVGAIQQPLPKPFIAVVVDNGNNRLAGVPVTFTVQQGGGAFGGQSDVTVTSDSDGRVAATLTLGNQEGNANNVVAANFANNQGSPAAFTASGRAPGDPANTTISGVILDNTNNPIPGVTIRAVLTNVLHSNVSSVQLAAAVPTDAQGQFSIPQAPVGFVKLMVDGSTAQLVGTYPSLEYDIVTVAGQNNTVGQPIYLLSLNSANQLCVTPTTGGGTLTIPEAPGFSLTFGPGQVTFPGGSKTGCISVTVVHGDKVPMVPGFGQQPRFIVTIQPSGAIFNGPAAITLPNVDGLKPREVTEMYSFDHDIGSFVAIGTGVVSDDGQVIRSSQGVGVLKAGWHCGGNPGSSGAAASCPVCFFCPGSLSSCQAQGNGVACGNGGTCQFGQGCVGGGGSCPPGSTFNATRTQCCQGATCNIQPTCPSGQTFDPITGLCVNSGRCAPGWTLNASGQCCLGGTCIPPSFVNTCTPQTAAQFCNAGGGPSNPGTCVTNSQGVAQCIGSSPGQCGQPGCNACSGPSQCSACLPGQTLSNNGQCVDCSARASDADSLLIQTQMSLVDFQTALNSFNSSIGIANTAAVFEWGLSSTLALCLVGSPYGLLPACAIDAAAVAAASKATSSLRANVLIRITNLDTALRHSQDLLQAAQAAVGLLQGSQCGFDQSLVARRDALSTSINGPGSNSLVAISELAQKQFDQFTPWDAVDGAVTLIKSLLSQIEVLLGLGDDATILSDEVVDQGKQLLDLLMNQLKIFQ